MHLIDAGFLGFVAEQAKVLGDKAWLFPKVAPATSGARAFSKWFGRYIGAHGINDHAKVFIPSADALRLTGVGEDVRRALVGHTEGGVPGSAVVAEGVVTA